MDEVYRWNTDEHNAQTRRMGRFHFVCVFRMWYEIARDPMVNFGNNTQQETLNKLAAHLKNKTLQELA